MLRFSPRPNNANLIKWREWSPKAFDEAKARKAPVMLLVSAFWCGVCQRMDETSFSNDAIITLINGYFIPIRVEDAQRPDIDIRYNQNGWPTVVFMTPSGGHLLSVNYLPPEQLADVLVQVHQAYNEQRDHIKENMPQSRSQAILKQPNESTRQEPGESVLHEVSAILMALADNIHGGYGSDSKFPDVEANEFLLQQYESTKDPDLLGHVTLTLDKMWTTKIRDEGIGGFFRYSSKPDWNEPHKEKLLQDQAGLLSNYLHTFTLTNNTIYKQRAEEIISYLDKRLSDNYTGAFYGCQDLVRGKPPEGLETDYDIPGWFSIIDECIYTDANSKTVGAYLEAWRILGRQDCLDRALRTLEFLWAYCHDPVLGTYHYFDDTSHVPGLLKDQVSLGDALLKAYDATKELQYIGRSEEIARDILNSYVNPSGGFYDIKNEGEANLQFKITPLSENSATGAFLAHLGSLSNDPEFTRKSLWALQPFTSSFRNYGVSSAGYGLALSNYLSL